MFATIGADNPADKTVRASSLQLDEPTVLADQAVPAGLAELQAQAGRAAALLKVLSNPDRLMLLCHLVDGERSVNELGAAVGVGQPSLSQQLAVLRAERLVATRRQGQQVLYRLASPAALAVLQALQRLYCPPDAP